MGKEQDSILTDEILKKAGDYTKKKVFRENLPIVIVEHNKLYRLYKDNTKEFIKELEPNIE